MADARPHRYHRPSTRNPKPVAHLSQDSPRRLRALPSCVAAALGLAASAFAQAPAAKPDQVFRIDPRTGKVAAISGRVETHGLERVVVIRRDDQQGRYDSSEVIDVVFGDVPPAFTDAQRYLERGDHENAVARFRVAAGDAAARPVVQARARLGAAEALLAWGASDPTRFREAADEAASFLASYADDRNVPRARALQGRAQVLAGDFAGGAATLKALFETGQASAVGYPKVLTLRAGYDAAHAFLAAGNQAEGRAMFDTLGSALAAISPDGLDAAAKAAVADLTELVSLGQGFVALADGKGDRAESAFRDRESALQTGAGRAAAQLGLGEALLLQKKHRPALLVLAKASALSYASADLEARAMVGVAQSYLGLGDAAEAKKSLERVRRVHGATPAAAKAAELLKTL